MLSSEENGPRYSSRVLSLQEKGFGFAILESENLAVTTDVELALFIDQSVSIPLLQPLRDNFLFLDYSSLRSW